MTTRRAPQPPAPQDADDRAWFLDVDGTLLEIAREPHLVTADADLLSLLVSLRETCGGAVALVSGRSLEQIDDIFGRFDIAAAGSHGLELRLPDGTVERHAGAVPAASLAVMEDLASRHGELLLERKPFSASLHYRRRPGLELQVLEAMEAALRRAGGGFRLLRGKMVVELLPLAADKGSAIRTFMENPPFRGRRPVFAGDDVTDEHGFAVVNAMRGTSVRVGGSAATAANWRLANVTALRAWLRAALAPAGNAP